MDTAGGGAAQVMRVGPSESPCRGRTPNHRKLRRLNGRGGERCGKGAPGVRQVRARKANESEPPYVSKRKQTASKPGSLSKPGRSLGDTCLLPRRRPA